MELLCCYASFYDKHISREPVNLPPPSLRYKVLGRPEASVFLNKGKRMAEDIEKLLKKESLDIDSFEKVLDFGCGCGRTLRWFSDRKPKFYGTDLDPEAIDWCKKNLEFATFDTNNLLPPLKYEDCTFDFINVVSVFTHLNEDVQFKWINELHRILKKDGIMLATFHGIGTWSWLLPNDLHNLQKKGFIYKTAMNKKDLLYAQGHCSHHTKEYVIEMFSKRFKVLTYVEQGLEHLNFQDVALFQKT